MVSWLVYALAETTVTFCANSGLFIYLSTAAILSDQGKKSTGATVMKQLRALLYSGVTGPAPTSAAPCH